MTIDTQKLRELLEKATPGPWDSMTYRNGSPRVGHGPNCTVADVYWPADGGDAQVNATLIAETRNALPALLDHIDAQAAENKRLHVVVRMAFDALNNYERMGEVCPFEGQPMIYAETLVEIGEAARAALSGGHHGT